MKVKVSLNRPFKGLLLVAVLAMLGILPQGTASANGTPYYVKSCPPGLVGSGTIGDPWCTFNQVNNMTFLPGDRLWLARGSTWNQELRLGGSGTSLEPITVDAYQPAGAGTTLPQIIRSGAESDRGIYMTNVSHWTIRNLEIGKAGVGILAYYPISAPVNNPWRGLTFENLYLHDITGIYRYSGSGGAQWVHDSSGIVITAPGVYNDSGPNLTDIRISTINATRNQNSIMIQGGGTKEGTVDTYHTKKTISNVSISNIYLHDDDGLQPNTPLNTKTWMFNSATNNLEGWNSPYNMSVSVANGDLNTTTLSGDTASYIHSPVNLNIDPYAYRYVRITLKNELPDTATPAPNGFIYFRRASDVSDANPSINYFRSMNVERISAEGTATLKDKSRGYVEYVVDMGRNPDWAPRTPAGLPAKPELIYQLRLDFRNAQIMRVDSIKVARRGCDDSVKIVGVVNFQISDAWLGREAACNSETGTAAVFLGADTNGRLVNTMIRDTPAFAGNNDMDGIDFESYNDTLRVQNSYFAGNAGPGINILTRASENINDYSANHSITGNLFANNGYGYTPTMAAIREARSSLTALATGTIARNLHRENGGLFTNPPAGADPTLITVQPDNLAVGTNVYAANEFTGAQNGGWKYSYRLGLTGAMTQLTFSSPTNDVPINEINNRWGTTTTGIISRFTQRPASSANAQVIRSWTVPANIGGNGFASIRSRAILSHATNPALQSSAGSVQLEVIVTQANGTSVSIWPAVTLNASNWTEGLEQQSEIELHSGDTIHFIVTNTSSTPANVPTISWVPAIGIR
jgi:hypothetical protein